jgi:uncharacterized membrane protein
MTTTLTLRSFDSSHGAEESIAILGRREDRGQLPPIQDIALMCWPTAAGRPQAHQVTSLYTQRPLSGAFWGLLFSVTFLLPLIGPGGSAAGNSLSEIGLDGDVVATLRSMVTPGTSALLILSTPESAAQLDQQLEMTVDQWSRTLDDGQVVRLRLAFADPESSEADEEPDISDD